MVRPVLVLDMDETMLHTSGDQIEDPSYQFTVDYEGETCYIYGRTRPNLNDFLEKMTMLYDIVVFTASRQIYAEKVLDSIDPTGRFFKKRYYRHHCTMIQDHCIKNLEILGYDLAHTIIVDDEPHFPATHQYNIVKINDWIDDPYDSSLMRILPLLRRLAYASDVRDINWYDIKMGEYCLIPRKVTNFFRRNNSSNVAKSPAGRTFYTLSPKPL